MICVSKGPPQLGVVARKKQCFAANSVCFAATVVCFAATIVCFAAAIKKKILLFAQIWLPA